MPTQIGQVRAGQAATLDVTVEAILPPRQVTQESGTVGVVECLVSDTSGNATLSLWGADGDGIEVGQRLHLERCYAKLYDGGLQLSKGKFGAISVVPTETAKGRK